MKHMKKGSRWPVNPVVWVIVALLVILGGYKFFYPNHVEPEHTTARQSSSTKVIDVEEGSSSAKKATTKNININQAKISFGQRNRMQNWRRSLVIGNRRWGNRIPELIQVAR